MRLAARRPTIPLALLVIALGTIAAPARGADTPYAGPTPGRHCAPGALREDMQGRVPAADFDSGRVAAGYRCNAIGVGHLGESGGYRVERYVDKAGRECAYYDSDTFIGEQIPKGAQTGVYVVDMTDPTDPKHVNTLVTPAMQSPHESLRLNATRGLLAAATSTIATGPGQVEIYSVEEDCRHPVLKGTTPFGLLGHEGAFAPDGKTYYVSSLTTATISAVDVTDPTVPLIPWFFIGYAAHGMSVSEDGNRLYVAEAGGFRGLTILDVTQVQGRIPFPTVPLVSRLTWPEVSVPQNATPFTRDGRSYLLEVDEFGERITGAARIIDISDEKNPFVVSNLRLEVNQPEVYDELQNDPGNANTGRGYQAHYCTVPSRVDPNIVACSFIMSGLRVFDIRDVGRPRELAYFNKPILPGADPIGNVGAFAMSAPAYDHASNDVWYTDGNSGFHVVRLIGPAGVKFAEQVVHPGS